MRKKKVTKKSRKEERRIKRNRKKRKKCRQSENRLVTESWTSARLILSND